MRGAVAKEARKLDKVFPAFVENSVLKRRKDIEQPFKIMGGEHEQSSSCFRRKLDLSDEKVGHQQRNLQGN